MEKLGFVFLKNVNVIISNACQGQGRPSTRMMMGMLIVDDISYFDVDVDVLSLLRMFSVHPFVHSAEVVEVP